MRLLIWQGVLLSGQLKIGDGTFDFLIFFTMTYLLLGEDEQLKQAKIADLKNKHLTSADAFKFDFEVLHGTKLDSKMLKETLMALPAVAKRRFILIYACHKLSAHNKKLIEEFVSAQYDNAVLILESSQMTRQDAFVKKITRFVKTVDFSTVPKINVFDIMLALTQRRGAAALKILHELLSDGTHPLQIMGGIVWSWKKSRQRLSKQKYEKGLVALQEADLDVKRSRLNPDYALELLIVKLGEILG